MESQTRVGLGVITIKNKKVLLLKRQGSHGSGTWAFIGGHLEFGESPEQGAKREVNEEIGIKLGKLSRSIYTNDFFPMDNKHYITLFLIARSFRGKPKIKEPDKIEKLEWFEWGKFPKPLFIPLGNLLKTGFNPIK